MMSRLFKNASEGEIVVAGFMLLMLGVVVTLLFRSSPFHERLRESGRTAQRAGVPVTANPFKGVDGDIWMKAWIAEQQKSRQ